jgi:type IV pilus assembly protein PilB
MSTILPRTANAAAVRAGSPRVSRSMLLGERLVRAGVVTQADVERALAQVADKHVRLGEALLELGLIDEPSLLACLEEQLGVPAVQLREALIDPQVVHLIPRATAEAFRAIAIFKIRNRLTVCMADPLQLEQVDELERITGCKVRPVLAREQTIAKLLPVCYRQDFAVDTVTAEMGRDAVEVHADAETLDLGSVELLAEGSPVVNLVNYVIVHALREKASDIHIEPGPQASLIRFRVDGQLREVLRPRKEFHPALVSRVKVMARLDIAEHRLPQDGRIHVSVEGRKIDLRVSTLPTILGEKIVLRVLDRRNVTFNLDQLGMPGPVLARVKSMLARPYGLLLVTGPTGSGKTTTLYSAIELIRSVHRNIVTVEDPVEYQLEGINQVQVGTAKTLTFAAALRSILRQDPDVIMVGEIRDAETASVAIGAALTGHLVLSTLHTNDSVSALTRLVDMGIESYKIAASLAGVVAQRLLRTLCANCRKPYFPPAELLALVHYQGDDRRPLMRGAGCRQCHDTGFQGRTGIYEVLTATRTLREAITHAPNIDALRELHAQQGGTFLLKEGLRLAESGRTSLDEVIRTAFIE